MISYELALKLKEAGFPPPEEEKGMQSWVLQETFGAAYAKGLDNIFRLFPGCVYCPDALTYIPTLSELIEACGDENVVLFYWADVWNAGIASSGSVGQNIVWKKLMPGLTKEESAAKLWLKLHEKKN